MVSGLIAVYAVVGGMPYVAGLLTATAEQPANDATAKLRIVEAVLQHIQNDYVDEPNMDKVRLRPASRPRRRTRSVFLVFDPGAGPGLRI